MSYTKLMTTWQFWTMNFALNTKFWTFKELRRYSWKQPIKYWPEMSTVLSQGCATTDWTCNILETTNTTGRKMTFKGHKQENGDRSNSKIPWKFSSNTITHCFKKFWSETRLVFCDEETTNVIWQFVTFSTWGMCLLTICKILAVTGRFVEVWDQFGTQFKPGFPQLFPCCATGEHHCVEVRKSQTLPPILTPKTQVVRLLMQYN
jgi:hypothetical protein